MDQSTSLERFASWLREHPFAVDAGLAGLFFVLTALIARSGYDSGSETFLALLFSVPLAWRRRAPVPAAAAVTVVGLLQLVVYAYDLITADVAALVMIYALAA